MYFPTSSSDSPNRLRITVSCLNEFLFQKSAGALTSKQHGNSRVYTAHLKRSSCPKKSCYSADWILLKELLLSTKHAFKCYVAFDGGMYLGNTSCHAT